MRFSMCFRRIPHFPVQRNFRQSYLYSNYLYLMAGYITEVVDGRTWEEHIRQLLFDPLGETRCC